MACEKSLNCKMGSEPIVIIGVKGQSMAENKWVTGVISPL